MGPEFAESEREKCLGVIVNSSGKVSTQCATAMKKTNSDTDYYERD